MLATTYLSISPQKPNMDRNLPHRRHFMSELRASYDGIMSSIITPNESRSHDTDIGDLRCLYIQLSILYQLACAVAALALFSDYVLRIVSRICGLGLRLLPFLATFALFSVLPDVGLTAYISAVLATGFLVFQLEWSEELHAAFFVVVWIIWPIFDPGAAGHLTAPGLLHLINLGDKVVATIGAFLRLIGFNA